MGINFGGYVFTDPIQISQWLPPYRAGLYAILIPNFSCTPRPFEAIYFGESGNMSDRGFLNLHHRYSCWISRAGSEAKLDVSVYLMPDSTPEERRIIERLLIEKYIPSCNAKTILGVLIK